MANLPLERSQNQTTRYNFDRIAERLGPLSDFVRFGLGTPENAVAANVGSLYLRLDGGTGTTAYTKESGTGSTGWAALDSGTAVGNHDLLSTTHPDTVASSPSRGSIIRGNSTPAWEEFNVGTSGQYLGTDGTDVLWRAQSTLDHGSIGGLSDDDHAQYLLLAGRTGTTNNPTISTSTHGTITGSSAAGGSLTLKPSSNSAAAELRFDLSGQAAHVTDTAINALIPTTLGAAQTVYELCADQTIAMNAGGGFRALVVRGTFNHSGNPAGTSYLTFNFNPTIALDGTASTNLNTGTVYKASGQVTLTSGVAYGNVSSSWINFDAGFNLAAAAGGATATVTLLDSYRSAETVDTGWTVTTLKGFEMTAPAGSGTITNLVGIDIADLDAYAGTTTNNPIALRCTGSVPSIRLQGPTIIGSTGAPNTTQGLDLSGDFATRETSMTVTAGSTNNNLAIGSTSFVRITGSPSNQLNGSITNSATTITVDSTTGFAASGTILIEAEKIDYTGTTATTFTGCTRGVLGTSAEAHADNVPVYQILTSQVAITGMANGFNGKRVILYNATGENMEIHNNSTSSTAANRFTTNTGATVTISGDGAVEFFYDASASRWVLTGSIV